MPPTGLAFAPGGLQPADLVPGLPDLGNVTGRAEISAQVVLTPQQLSRTAALKLEDMNLQSGDIARDTKLIQVHQAQQLLVEARLDAETYKPAEKAMIEFLTRK